LGATIDAAATILVRATGIEADLVPGEVTLELVGDWDVTGTAYLARCRRRVGR
jgi:hypothetical protein